MPNRVRIPAALTLMVISILAWSMGQTASASIGLQGTATFGPIVTGTAAATSAATLAVTPTPLPNLNHDLMGIQAYGYVGEGDWGTLMDRSFFMGFKWVKIQLSWKELEPVKGQYSQQFDVITTNFFDTGRFRGYGYKIMLSIAKAPDWARPANARGQNDGPPTNPQDLIDFLNHVFDRFDTTRLNAIEIWNEANTSTEWTGAPITGAEYMKLFNPVYKAIRAKLPNVTVVSAGPAPAGPVNDRQWLQQVYDAGLPLSDLNLAVGVHPYGWANPPDARCCASPSKGWDNNPGFFFLDTINDYHQIMLKNKDTQHKLWATEFGWSSFKGLHVGSHVDGLPVMPPTDSNLGWMNVLDDHQQANYIIQAFQLAQTGDLAGYMGPMFVWNLNYSTLKGYVFPDKPSAPEAGFSLLDSDSAPRPIYDLLQQVKR